jgi:hypothetical protein
MRTIQTPNGSMVISDDIVKELRVRLERTLEEMDDGLTNPLQAVNIADERIGKILAVRFIARESISLDNMWRLRLTAGVAGYNLASMTEFAALAYNQAQKNGSREPGEVHLGQGLSSKHYADRLKQYTSNLLAKYAMQEVGA